MAEERGRKRAGRAAAEPPTACPACSTSHSCPAGCAPERGARAERGTGTEMGIVTEMGKGTEREIRMSMASSTPQQARRTGHTGGGGVSKPSRRPTQASDGVPSLGGGLGGTGSAKPHGSPPHASAHCASRPESTSRRERAVASSETEPPAQSTEHGSERTIHGGEVESASAPLLALAPGGVARYVSVSATIRTEAPAAMARPILTSNEHPPRSSRSAKGPPDPSGSAARLGSAHGDGEATRPRGPAGSSGVEEAWIAITVTLTFPLPTSDTRDGSLASADATAKSTRRLMDRGIAESYFGLPPALRPRQISARRTPDASGRGSGVSEAATAATTPRRRRQPCVPTGRATPG
eukprot:scaffold28988_cov101-Isochrysis_galbana.AAC.2